jgi:hypothetical protein
MNRLIALSLMGTPMAPLYSRVAMGYNLGQDLLGLFTRKRVG